MTTIKKYFDAAVADPAATPTEPQQAPVSIAELMAKSGVVNTNSDTPVATPISIPEKKEEPTATTADPAETATTATPAATATPESPSPTTEPTPAPEVKQTQEPVKVPTWQEVLKSQQPDAILKELGFDDKLVGFVKELKDADPKMLAFFNHWKQNNGDVKDYLRELATDYSKMSAEDVMRHQLRLEYPKASDAAINALFKREIIEAYNLDSEDQAELEEGRLLLEAKAEKYRDAFSVKQQEYLLPKPQEPKPEQPDPQIEARQKAVEAYQNSFRNDPYTQAISSSKAIVFGEGEEKFTLSVNPEALQEYLFNDEKWQNSLVKREVGPDGGTHFIPNTKKQFLIAAIMDDKNDGQDFLNAYANHFRAIGAKKIIEPIQNPSAPVSTTSPSDVKPLTPAEAMARQGRINSGGY